MAFWPLRNSQAHQVKGVNTTHSTSYEKMLDIRRHVIDGGRAAAGYFGGGVLWIRRDYRAAR